LRKYRYNRGERMKRGSKKVSEGENLTPEELEVVRKDILNHTIPSKETLVLEFVCYLSNLSEYLGSGNKFTPKVFEWLRVLDAHPGKDLFPEDYRGHLRCAISRRDRFYVRWAVEQGCLLLQKQYDIKPIEGGKNGQER